jgi:hypothetical protein
MLLLGVLMTRNDYIDLAAAWSIVLENLKQNPDPAERNLFRKLLLETAGDIFDKLAVTDPWVNRAYFLEVVSGKERFSRDSPNWGHQPSLEPVNEVK